MKDTKFTTEYCWSMYEVSDAVLEKYISAFECSLEINQMLNANWYVQLQMH